MDYHAIHGYDVATFDVPPTHRRPPISASQALEELKNARDRCISTGLDTLDEGLLGNDPVNPQESARRGGVKRGQVTEIWGPPGSGRTAIGIQLAANALNRGLGVVWIDCFHSFHTERIARVVQHVRQARGSELGRGTPAKDPEPKPEPKPEPEPEPEPPVLTQYACETLPHLLALLARPTTASIAGNVALLVVSGISALINSGLPKSSDGKAAAPGKGPTPSAKRLRGLQNIISGFQKLALARNIAVVLLSQCATSIKSEHGATLVPAVNATVWEQGISTRVVLFRDWAWRDEKASSVFLAGLQKTGGRAPKGPIEHISAFNIDTTGISDAPYEAPPDAAHQPAPHEATSAAVTPRRKRKRVTADLAVAEIADSEDDGEEDYGWADEDEDGMPPPPSQWQGSEDLILGPEAGSEEEEEGEGEGDEEAGSSSEAEEGD